MCIIFRETKKNVKNENFHSYNYTGLFHIVHSLHTWTHLGLKCLNRFNRLTYLWKFQTIPTKDHHWVVFFFRLFYYRFKHFAKKKLREVKCNFVLNKFHLGMYWRLYLCVRLNVIFTPLKCKKKKKKMQLKLGKSVCSTFCS